MKKYVFIIEVEGTDPDDAMIKMMKDLKNMKGWDEWDEDRPGVFGKLVKGE